MLNASSDSTEVVERVLMADWTNISLESAGVLHSWSAGEKTTEVGRPDDRTKGALEQRAQGVDSSRRFANSSAVRRAP